MTKVVFYTLGCKANQYQTSILKCQMSSPSTCLDYARHESLGTSDQCQTVDFGQPADIYVINTCTVTEDADRKSRQAIRRALRSGKKVIVAGCLARTQKQALLDSFPGIDIVDPDPLAPHPSRLEQRRETPLTPRIRANLMIQDGCEHFCSYCIVPYARGKFASKPADQVIEEAEQMVNAGAQEIVLTGINLGSYRYDLPSVVSRLSTINDLLRIRLSSVEPMYLTRELIDAVAATPKACRHFHLPLQSGDNGILKAMNRGYSRGDYLELIHYIRGRMPDSGITTDIIVGFPGEGEKEFQNTLDLANEVKFSRLHIFPFSKRKGTPAADLPGQVNILIIKKRSSILHELRNRYMKEFAEQYIGKEVEILVEQKGEGLTSNYIRCFFDDPLDSSGSLKKIFARSVNNSGEIRV